MNGVNGASSCVTVTRQVRSVANAAGSPSQKRRRERRTYQLERSSTKACDGVAGAGGVVVLQPLGDRLDGGREAADSAQRSRSLAGATSAGSTPLTFAYIT